MSNARDALADLIDEHSFQARSYSEAAADAVLAEGYRKTHTVTTFDELDALPLATVIRDAAGFVFEHWKNTPDEAVQWAQVGYHDPSNPILPGTVLYVPEEAARA